MMYRVVGSWFRLVNRRTFNLRSSRTPDGGNRMRRMHRSFRVGLRAALAFACACGGDRNGPTSPPASNVIAVTVAGAAIGRQFQCTATAHFSDGAAKDVTTEASWETSTPSIATVSSAGVVTVIGTGDVDIRASFRQMSGSFHFFANPGPGATYTLTGVVSDSSNARAVVAASVQIVDGVNEGKRLITDGTGYFSLNDLFPASFTLRATHERYRTVDQALTLAADTRLDVALPPVAPTIVITPAGIDTKVLTVWVGAQITFVNADNRVHRMFSDPHPQHTDCPPLNDVGFLSPGAARTSGTLNIARTCGFHDHGEAENTSLNGTII